jgi:hypothetical protein
MFYYIVIIMLWLVTLQGAWYLGRDYEMRIQVKHRLSAEFEASRWRSLYERANDQTRGSDEHDQTSP